jgi:hypothetical protein
MATDHGDYRISYHSVETLSGKNVYQGLYAMPGDSRWRVVRSELLVDCEFSSAQAAEAAR